MTPSCLIADDHPALLTAIADYLGENGFEVTAAVATGSAAVAAAAHSRPALALLDYRMPGAAGAQLVREVKDASPHTRVAVYTADADERVVSEVLAAGADGVVLKDSPLDDLVRALTSILEGRPYVDPGLAPLGLVRAPAKAELTTREVEVLTLLAEGLSHEEIGKRLEIGPETVRTHARKAADRLGARTRTQAVATAIRLGLLA